MHAHRRMRSAPFIIAGLVCESATLFGVLCIKRSQMPSSSISKPAWAKHTLHVHVQAASEAAEELSLGIPPVGPRKGVDFLETSAPGERQEGREKGIGGGRE